jgi:hypothetical protein
LLSSIQPFRTLIEKAQKVLTTAYGPGVHTSKSYSF